MCMLTFMPAETVAEEDHLENGCVQNDDGHGWAIVSGDQLLQGHSMDAAEALETFYAARKHHMVGPALFHSRWATHGAVDVTNVHPFRVGRDAGTVLAHNGILNATAQPGPGDRRSDTRKFAQSILPGVIHNIDRPKVQKAIRDFLGGNKIVILTVNPHYAANAYLFGEKYGDWVEGVWFSNGDYKRTPWVSTARAPGWANDDDYWAGWDNVPASVCDTCGVSDGVDPVSNYCWKCETCLDCLAPIVGCLCYPGATSHGSALVSDIRQAMASKKDWWRM